MQRRVQIRTPSESAQTPSAQSESTAHVEQSGRPVGVGALHAATPPTTEQRMVPVQGVRISPLPQALLCTRAAPSLEHAAVSPLNEQMLLLQFGSRGSVQSAFVRHEREHQFCGLPMNPKQRPPVH